MSYQDKKAALDATRDSALRQVRIAEKARRANEASVDHIRRLEHRSSELERLRRERQDLDDSHNHIPSSQRAKYSRAILDTRTSSVPEDIYGPAFKTLSDDDKKKIIMGIKTFGPKFMNLTPAEQEEAKIYKKYLDDNARLTKQIDELEKEHLEEVMDKTRAKRGEGKIHASQNFINDSIVHKINGGYKINFMKLRK